ncbi:MAG TPA: ABC transporter ATP-binding protein, partial [Bacteroidales bacterium]|nr:ABC transporter ATP-binding protein [Bacteroidales bacterium]
MNQEPLLQIKNLCIDFYADGSLHRAVDHVNIALQQGKTLGIVGESGSGKTVTALSVLRLLPEAGLISEGEIWFAQKIKNPLNVLQTPLQEMRKIRGNQIGMIFQEPMTSLNPVKKCGLQVVESMMVHLNYSFGKAKQHALELFGEVLLPRPASIFSSYPHQLSGGQKQRVMIAMAMACNPALLIADEPTTALDVTVQKSIIALMKSLQQKYQMGMLYISHDLGVVSQIADEVAVMFRGKVVESGPVKNIFNQPEHPYTKGLIACRPGMGRRPAKLPVVADFIDANARKQTPTIT